MMSPMMFVTTVGKPLMWVSAVLIATLSITIIISSIVAFVFIWNTKYSAACWSLVVPLAQVLLIALIFVIM